MNKRSEGRLLQIAARSG